MKKIFALLLILIISCSIVLAQGQKIGSDEEQKGPEIEHYQEGSGVQEQVQQETQNQGEEQQIMVQQQTKTQQKQQVQAMIQDKQQEMNQELEAFGKKEQKVYRNQNQVRLAVHALLAMENLTGGIGSQVSAIAQDFNNRINKTIQAEEKIQKRSAFKRFFAGGDHEAAQGIEQEVNRNRERIQELKQLKEQCECDEEVKAMIQEQIQNMEQEQNRLQELAQKEKKSKGLFGWIWK